jgi:hypothetical protein
LKSLSILGDVPSKKNSKQIIYVRGRPIIIPSKNHKTWHTNAQNQLYGSKSLSGLSGITLTFYPSTRRKSDLTNKAESVMDLLVDCGIIPDDNWFEVPKVVLQFGGIDKQNPRCEILINQTNV